VSSFPSDACASTDLRRLNYCSHGSLRRLLRRDWQFATDRVPIAGGAPVTLCQAGYAYGLTWGADGILFVERDKAIMRVDPDGGAPTALVPLTDGEAVQRPQTLPGGQHLLFTLATGSGPDRWDRARVVVQSLTSGKRKTLFEGGSDARYLPTGHIVYAVGGSLFAIAFDAQRLEVRGSAVPMVEGVRRSGPSLSLGGAQFSVSSNGSLVYIPGAVSAQWDLGLTDRRGEVTPFNLQPGPYEVPRVSPDGKRVAYGSDDGKEAAVWIYDRSDGSSNRLTLGGNNRFPTWSSDGKHVVFQSDRGGNRGLFWQPVDGGEAVRLTTPNAGEAHEPESSYGDRLLFSVTKGSDVSLWMLSLADKESTPFGDVHSKVRTGAVFSPDGRWVAYATTEGSTTTIYVQPFPPTGYRRQLPPKDGEPKHPVWSSDGGQLFYNPGPGQFESVSVTKLPFAFGNPVPLPRPFPGAPPSARRPYDITPDGKFVSPIAAGQSRSGRASAPPIQVVLNWFEDLRARVPLPK
jgi:eukaryotic-like serine/threonine-protein kinase